MVTKTHGSRVKTRRKLRKKELTRITDLVRDFSVGDKVLIKIRSNIQKGMPHPRYHGRAGVVTGKRGRAFEVQIKDMGKKIKTLISIPAHLKPMASGKAKKS